MPDEKSRGPQLEDGFGQYAHELMSAACRHPMPDRYRRVVFGVMRFTYGFDKSKMRRVKRSDLAEFTGIPRQRVSVIVAHLVAMKIIHQEPGHHGAIGINKMYNEWLDYESPRKGSIVPHGGDNSIVPHGGDNQLYPTGVTINVPHGGDNQEKHSLKDLNKRNNNHNKANSTTFSQVPPAREDTNETPKTVDEDAIKNGFNQAVEIYPSKDQPQPLLQAEIQWRNAIKQGVTIDQLLAAIRAYLAWCEWRGIVGTRFVKRMDIFLGPEKFYAQLWEIPDEDDWSNLTDSERRQKMDEYARSSAKAARKAAIEAGLD